MTTPLASSMFLGIQKLNVEHTVIPSKGSFRSQVITSVPVLLSPTFTSKAFGVLYWCDLCGLAAH